MNQTQRHQSWSLLHKKAGIPVLIQLWNIVIVVVVMVVPVIVVVAHLRHHHPHELVEIYFGHGSVTVLAFVLICGFGSRPLDFVHGNLEIFG